MLGVIPAAGKGTRFHELGKQYPKCILPYEEKPIIVHNIKRLLEAGCEEVIVGASYRSSMIEEVVNDYFPEDNVRVVEIVNTDGMPDTVLQCVNTSELEDTVSLLIMLGDVVTTKPISEDLSVNWISVRHVTDYNRWCMVQTDGIGIVENFIDKSDERPDTTLAATGIYHINEIGEFIKYCDDAVRNHDSWGGNELQLSTVLMELDDIHTVYPEIKDLGTHEEYINNRGLSTSRQFNEIVKQGQIITKLSNDHEKIRAEYHWFRDLPLPLKGYTPATYDLNVNPTGRTSYYMEFVEKPTLRELFLFLDGSVETWEQIFNDVFQVQRDFSQLSNFSKTFLNKMLDKTVARYHQLEFVEDGDDTTFALMVECLQCMQERGDFYKHHDSIAHGDFCFSNIMWSPGSVKLIDPRGEMFGSVYYEFAKLYHSVIGFYDFVDAELYAVDDFGEIKIYNGGKDAIQELFLSKLSMIFTDKEITLIKMLTASLFISMIPLHYHNETNQQLFMAKFRELYFEASAEYNSY